MSGHAITRTSLNEARNRQGETDWDRLASSPEADEGEDDFDWDTAEIVESLSKKPVSIRLDPDVLAFFKTGGKGYQTRINAVLRSYMKAQTSRQEGSG